MNKLLVEVKKLKEIVAPEWASFVKTGAHKERPPIQEDWWYIRATALLLKINKIGPIGTNKLSKLYGGRKNRGHKPDKTVSGSRNIIRKCLQQLEQAGLIKHVSEPKSGKIITKKGKELINKTN